MTSLDSSSQAFDSRPSTPLPTKSLTENSSQQKRVKLEDVSCDQAKYKKPKIKKEY